MDGSCHKGRAQSPTTSPATSSTISPGTCRAQASPRAARALSAKTRLRPGTVIRTVALSGPNGPGRWRIANIIMKATTDPGQTLNGKKQARYVRPHLVEPDSAIGAARSGLSLPGRSGRLRCPCRWLVTIMWQGGGTFPSLLPACPPWRRATAEFSALDDRPDCLPRSPRESGRHAFDGHGRSLRVAPDNPGRAVSRHGTRCRHAARNRPRASKLSCLMTA